MSPAKIECLDGTEFIVPDGKIPEDNGDGYSHLTDKDKEDLKLRAVMGTEEGYSVVLWSGEPIGIEVTPTSVTSKPPGCENFIEMKEGNVFTLQGGARVIPIAEKTHV